MKKKRKKPNINLCVNFLIVSEEIMTEEDEEFMLDNFVTFFIAGDSLLFHVSPAACDTELDKPLTK